MKIYAYRVVQNGPRSVDEVLRNLMARPLEERIFEGKASGLRLEDMRPRGNFILADFASKRFGHGPGRMADNAPLQEIALQQGESFGEDTGIIYDPRTNYLAIQYNHSGPRAARIQQYLFSADLSIGGLDPRPHGGRDEDRAGFRFGAILTPGAYDRVRDMGLVRQLEFEIAVPGARAQDIAAGRSLSGILDAPLPDGIEKLHVTMLANEGRDSHMEQGAIMGFIDDLMASRQIVKMAKVRGRAFDGATTEGLSLLDEQLTVDLQIPLGNGGRYSQDSRWTALQSAMAGWLEGGELWRD